ncbi:MAG: hypothetical protein QGF07_01295 [Phycisphaerales bacterium]|nr:hypothetical protein [Phycisphaerales bacterium]
MNITTGSPNGEPVVVCSLDIQLVYPLMETVINMKARFLRSLRG